MALLHPRTVAFLKYFAGAYPARTGLMVGLLVVSGLLEGVSVISLVPMLEAAASPGGSNSGLGGAVRNVLVSAGIQPTLWILVALVVIGITLKAVFLWLAMRQVGYTMARVTLDLRLRLVRALLNARWSFFGGQQLGVFSNSIGREAVQSANAYREACVVLGGVFQVIVYLIVSALISWQVTLVALATGAILLFGLKRFVAMGRSAGEDAMRLTRSLVARLIDSFQGIKPMKAMAREDYLWPLLKSESEGLNKADRKSVMAAETLRLFQEPIVALVLGINLIIMLSVADRSFSAVVVLAFVFYRLMTYLNNLQMHYQYMVNAEGMFWSLRNLIDEAEASVESHPGTRAPEGLREAIELRGVRFAYGDLTVLDGLNMRIPARTLTALVGRSGSGKTTIVDLVTGLHRPSDGEVFIDGVPLSALDMRGWRKQIGYVPQDVFLFHDTVRRNITLGDETIPDDRVIQALKDAGAWAFIARDPRGIDAVISPQGSGFSGGQRQRLAIARALAKDPALIVLDEATTGLDTQTEAAIMETLLELRGKVTILAISHQPALREAADLTIELEDGRVRNVVELDARRVG